MANGPPPPFQDKELVRHCRSGMPFPEGFIILGIGCVTGENALFGTHYFRHFDFAKMGHFRTELQNVLRVLLRE